VNTILLAILVATAPVDFDTEVLPVLTRAGCNAGACHGAAAGRGGFKLSLFGGDPGADYRAIVQELEGRRVNLARPERSLLLLKPTWEIDHEGGQRFEADSPQAKLIAGWIESGAPRLLLRTLVGLAVEPAQTTIESLPGSVSLQVTAQFSDGSSQRVEDAAVFTPADPAATLIDAQGRVQVLRPGRHAIVVRYLTHVEAVQITAPHPRAALDLSGQPRGNWIDDEINAALAALRLPPSPRADDAARLRRVTLDLTGRLPTPDRIRQFLAAAGDRQYENEVDRLLGSPEFTEYWAYKLSEWLRARPGPNDAEGTEAYHGWLRRQVAAARPLDELVAELITSSGDSHAAGPPNFHRSASDARGEAEHVAESLLAIRLRCANCHNHPLDRWTQDDYHGLAAIFARLDRGREVKLLRSGEVLHPTTGEAALPKIPGEGFIDPQADGRAELAAWLTSPENPYFARAWANRLWDALFGRGLVHPVDDLRDTNPATHPQLLNRLAREFAAGGFDMRRTLRLIALSDAYQRSSRADPASAHDDRFYSHALTRPLPRAVLHKAVCQATGVASGFERLISLQSGQRDEMRMQQMNEKAARIDIFGVAQCSGASPLSLRGEPPADTPEQLSGQLQWLSGEVVNSKLADPNSELLRLARARMPIRELIDEYYLRTLARRPSEAELMFWQRELAGAGRGKKCEDFAWSLLSCQEFVTNH
jgi:hypothetical protein